MADPTIIAKTRKGRSQWVVTCPYCSRKHYHGDAGGDGHRVAHCGAGGYYITNTPPSRSAGGNSVVYFIQEKGNPAAPIKIGFTAYDLNERLMAAQFGYPFGTLWIIAVREGTMADEQLEHERWDHLAMRGEWFAADNELREYIQKLANSYAESVTARVRASVVELGAARCRDS